MLKKSEVYHISFFSYSNGKQLSCHSYSYSAFLETVTELIKFVKFPKFSDSGRVSAWKFLDWPLIEKVPESDVIDITKAEMNKSPI